MPKKDDELVIPTELLEKDPNDLAQNESEIQTIISYLQKTRENIRSAEKAGKRITSKTAKVKTHPLKNGVRSLWPSRWRKRKTTPRKHVSIAERQGMSRKTVGLELETWSRPRRKADLSSIAAKRGKVQQTVQRQRLDKLVETMRFSQTCL